MTFEEMAQLKRGWDGEDGRPITPKAIETAKGFLTRMEFTPLPDGGIDLEFELPGVTPMGRSLLVTIGPKGDWVCAYMKIERTLGGAGVSLVDRFEGGEQKAEKQAD
jgi:hypothetical protein